MAGKDRELEYVMSLKDDATAAYKKFVSEVEKGSININSLAKGAGVALAGMFSINAASQFIEKYAEAQSGVDALTQTLRNQNIATQENIRGLLEQAEVLKQKTAVDDDEIIKAQNVTLALTQNYDATRQLIPVILDLAAGMNMSADEAAKLVAKTYAGTDAMSRYGIKIGETANQQDRLKKIVTEVTAAFGGQAEAFGNSTSGEMQKVANSFEDLEEAAGKLLYEGLQPMLPALQSIGSVASVITPVVYSLYAAFDRLASAMVAPLAVIEKLNNALGISESQYFSNLTAQLTRSARAFSGLVIGANDAGNAVDDAGKKSGRGGNNASAATQTWREKLDGLNTELKELDPTTTAYVNKLAQIKRMQDEAALATEKATQKARGIQGTTTLDVNFGMGFQGQLSSMQSAADKFFTDFNKESKKMFGGDVDPSALKAVEDQAALMQELRLRSFGEGKEKELALLNEWEQNAIAMAGEREDLITQVTATAAAERAKIEQEYSIRTFQQVTDFAQQAIGLYQQAVAQSSQATIQSMEARRNQELKGIDRERAAIKRKYDELLENEQLTAEQREVLRRAQSKDEEALAKRKEQTEIEYNDRIRGEKARAFNSQKNAQIIASVINTAVEVTKVLATPWMIPIVLGLGAAQTALIASQPTPSFHTGGAGYFNAPPSQEAFVKIRGQEKIDVYTPEQRDNLNGGRGINLVINFNAPVSDAQFVTNSIKKVLKETGLPIDQAFVNKTNSFVLE